MIPRDAQPIAHRSPRPRIDMNPVRRHEAEPELTFCQAIEAGVRAGKAREEAGRIWKLVVQSASATGNTVAAPDVPAVSVEEGHLAPTWANVYVDTAPSEYCAPYEDAA